MNNFDCPHEGCPFFFATPDGLYNHQTISPLERFHKREHSIIFHNRPQRTAIIDLLEGAKKRMRLDYENTIGSHAE